MLKTFNVVEKYEEILPFLETKKNQSSFICELILKEMREEQIEVSMEDLNQKILDASTSVIQEEIRKGIRNEIREEIRLEIRSEFRDLKRGLFEDLKAALNEVTVGAATPSTGISTGKGMSIRVEEGRTIKQVVKPLSSLADPFK